MRMRFTSYLLAANCAAMLSLGGASISSAQDKTASVVSSHVQTEGCSTSSGVLICTECREHMGLKAILTQGNAEWRPGSEVLEESKSQLVSFVNALVPAIDEKDHTSACDDEKCVCKEDEDDEDDDDEKKKHDSSGHGSRNHKGPGKRPGRKAPPHNGHQPVEHRRPPVRSLPPDSRPVQPHLLPMLRQPMPTPQAHPGVSMESTPAQLEALELMRNIHQRLKAIEGMMREEKERQSHRPPIAPQAGVPNAGAGSNPPVIASPYPAYFAPQQSLYLSPGSPYPGSPYPGSPYPGSPYPGSPYGGSPYPGSSQPLPPEQGPHQPGLHQPGPHQPGPHQPGPHQPGPHQPGPHQPGPHQPGPHQPGPHQPGPHQPGSHQPGPHQPGPHQPGPRQPGPHQPGPNQPGPHQPGPNGVSVPNFSYLFVPQWGQIYGNPVPLNPPVAPSENRAPGPENNQTM